MITNILSPQGITMASTNHIGHLSRHTLTIEQAEEHGPTIRDFIIALSNIRIITHYNIIDVVPISFRHKAPSSLSGPGYIINLDAREPK